MKACPNCGKVYNWWQWAIGEYKEHVRTCPEARQSKDELAMMNGCRGCPAGCFDSSGPHPDNGAPHGQGRQ